ncbi:erythromycin esterase family protein [Acuticoccus mangrovi]|uniref:Erythromycin esterase family protein n=1 Tax=Acuticoccus mangrovi TaxID=2796142 RepID=A0A934IQT8_9HYPH|nr:erythromycin esterase family protein [Acuticoccus mangrovi]MBJ3776587.1 erythromycin esterase family protein [Acuticoccus mangrovi]
MPERLIEEIRSEAIPLAGSDAAFDRILALAADARFVLIGEATHGTREFYAMRAELTKRLITEHGFAAVAAEADWPDAYRVNRYVRGEPTIGDADDALRDFERFPNWMWRNKVVRDFADWLRRHNDAIAEPSRKAGFYGLDLYSLEASIAAVVAYLDKVDPVAAKLARAHYGCFDHHHARNPQQYGYATMLGVSPSCEREVLAELVALRRNRFEYITRDGFAAGEEFYCAEQNATVVWNAEQYYRTMFEGRVSSWNLRDNHMVSTLYGLADHLHLQRGEAPKIVVWAHNSHVGDARATEMGERGECNIGSLIREAHGRNAVLVGFSTHHGSVRAASEWDGAGEVKSVRPAIAGSYEQLFHAVGLSDFLIVLRDNDTLHRHLDLSRLQRAIGVLYLPETERQSHYFFAQLPDQFDALVHIDETSALDPLPRAPSRQPNEVYETYPTGL